MPPVTLVDNEFANLWYHPETKIVHHKFHKFIYSDYFREVLTKGAQLIEKYKAEKYLSDDRGNTVVTPEDSQWGDTVWAPRVIKAGWKYWAIVMPEKVLGQINMRKFAEAYKGRGVVVQMFSDPDQAMAWLEAQ